MHYVTSRYQKKILPYVKSLPQHEHEKFFRDIDSAITGLVRLFGKDPKEVRWIILSIGLYLYGNSGKNFYLDYQKILLTDNVTLWTLQPPAGGCIHLFQTPEGKLLIDCGYGVNYDDWVIALRDLGLGSFSDTHCLLITHGDADHIGMAGFLPAPAYMHPLTKDLLESGSRGFAAVNNYQDLVKTYTKTINTISGLAMPKDFALAKIEDIKKRGPFSVINTVSFGGLSFEVWESKGGHLAGQLFYYEPDLGLLFTSDCILNFASITMPRKIYGAIPDYLITSVNINSSLATEERAELFAVAKELDSELRKTGKQLRLCCGHGAVSTFDEAGNMVVTDTVLHYARRFPVSEAIHQNLQKVSWMIRKKLC